MSSKEDSKTPLVNFFTKIGRRVRSKSPAAVKLHSIERTEGKENGWPSDSQPPTPNTPSSTRFSTFVNRLSRRKSKKIDKNCRESSLDRNEIDNCTRHVTFGSPRPAVSENDLRHVTLSRGTEMSVTPLKGVTFMSEDNLASADCGSTPYRAPSYLRISRALNGYTQSPRQAEDSPVKAMGRSLVERRLERFQNSPLPTTSTCASPAIKSSSVYEMGSNYSTPSPVKALIGQFDRLKLCSTDKEEDSKENAKPHKILVVDEPTLLDNEVRGKEEKPAVIIIDEQPCTSKGKEETEDSKEEIENEGVNEEDSASKKSEIEKTDNVARARTGENFLSILKETRELLLKKSQHALDDLEKANDMDESAASCIRMAAGKAQLLVRKKLSKFEELVNKNLSPIEGDNQPATLDDLEGYWALVEIELVDINECFRQVQVWRENNWIAVEGEPITLNNNDESEEKSRVVPKPRSMVPSAPTVKVQTEKQKAAAEQRKKLLADARAKAKKAQEESEIRPEGLMVL